MSTGLIQNYIKPYLGERYVRSLTVRDMDAYYTMLLDKPAVVVSGHMDTGAKITAHTVGRIHKLLKSAFSKAVVWEYTTVNPTIGATLPTAKAAKRAVWSDDEADCSPHSLRGAASPHLLISCPGVQYAPGGDPGLTVGQCPH